MGQGWADPCPLCLAGAPGPVGAGRGTEEEEGRGGEGRGGEGRKGRAVIDSSAEPRSRHLQSLLSHGGNFAVAMKTFFFASTVPLPPPVGAAEWKNSSGEGGGPGGHCPDSSQPGPYPREPPCPGTGKRGRLRARRALRDRRESLIPPPLHPRCVGGCGGGVRPLRARPVSRHRAAAPPGSPKSLCARRTHGSRSQRPSPSLLLFLLLLSPCPAGSCGTPAALSAPRIPARSRRFLLHPRAGSRARRGGLGG